MMRWRTTSLATAAVLAGALLVSTPAGAAPPAAPHAAAADPGTYSNPVTAGVVDTFPDPAMIRGKDGAWYAYGTTNPIFNTSGEPGEHILPIVRSTDMVRWEYVGDVYPAGSQLPPYWAGGTRPWAPDIRYIDGLYYLTYSLSNSGVALATAETPTGPWNDRGLLVRGGGVAGCPTNNIDQALFTDGDGTHYFYWGSYDVVCVSEMNADATALVGEVKQIAQGRRMEGAFVVQRDGFYYLMYSDAGCCDGAFSGYTVKVGRSESPTGPFVDDRGVDLMAHSSKGGFVLAPNGNGFAGPGHNAIQTDLAGQDWLVYHAIPEADPDFPPVDTRAGRLNLSKRPMMIDRLDWIDGWPVVNAGAGPSSGEQTAPVTTPAIGTDFTTGLDGFKGKRGVELTESTDAGAHARLASGATLTSHAQTSGDQRVQGDIRFAAGGADGSAGLTLGVRGQNGATAWIDRESGELRLEVTHGSRTAAGSAPLPDTFSYETWHVVAVEWRGDTVTAEVSADNLIDPLATVMVDAPKQAKAHGAIGVVADGAAVDADNLSAAALYEPVTERVADPEPGELLAEYSDEFDVDGTPEAADDAWSWVRRPASGPTVSDGALVWPTQGRELHLGNNTAPVLLRDTPQGDFLVETKLTFDGDRFAQQAGLVLYETDDRYLKLAHSVLSLSRKPGEFLHQTEFGKEMERPTATPPVPVANGPMFGAAPAETTWLRLYVQVDEADGEWDVRMASSTDGEDWQWGGVWSLPIRGELRLGLISMNTVGATAEFDYVRTFEMEPAN